MSRVSIVAMLVAVEVLIVGMALYLVGGHRSWASAAAMHRAGFTASAIAPLQAGTSPHVVIDDPDSRISVTASNDGLVHVTDRSSMHGLYSRALARLHVTHTGDDVRIQRSADGDRMVFFGFLHQHVDVSVPAGSRLEIVRCSGADVAGMTGSVSVRSQDGRISLDDLRGDVDAHTDDGRIAANDLAIARSGSLSTNDGSIHLSFARGADVTVDASTSDGSLEIDGTRVPHDDSDAVRHTLRVGAGTGNLRVSTDDGSIHITTHGVQ